MLIHRYLPTCAFLADRDVMITAIKNKIKYNTNTLKWHCSPDMLLIYGYALLCDMSAYILEGYDGQGRFFSIGEVPKVLP